MKKFEPLLPPRSNGGQYSYEGVLVVEGHPYGVFIARELTQHNQWYQEVHLRPFIEIDDGTIGPDEPLPDGNGHPDHTRKRK